jgi:hypothetical protein
MPQSLKSKKTTSKKPKCGLCGKSGSIVKTPCCEKLICNDADQYVAFSYARNSCFANHSRYTLCSYHFNERHSGSWKTCEDCRNDFEPEIYAGFGTNQHNFERLEKVPEYEPTLCAECQKPISLANDGYTVKPSGEHLCEKCFPPVRF